MKVPCQADQSWYSAADFADSQPSLTLWLAADVGETVVRALLSSGALDAAQLCKRAAETQDGLQRDFRQGELFLPQEALFWWVVVASMLGMQV